MDLIINAQSLETFRVQLFSKRSKLNGWSFYHAMFLVKPCPAMWKSWIYFWNVDEMINGPFSVPMSVLFQDAARGVAFFLQKHGPRLYCGHFQLKQSWLLNRIGLETVSSSSQVQITVSQFMAQNQSWDVKATKGLSGGSPFSLSSQIVPPNCVNYWT